MRCFLQIANSLLLCAILFVSQSAAQSDMFWSLRSQGVGAENSELGCFSQIGQQYSAYLYLDLDNTGLDSVTQLLVEVSCRGGGVVGILGGEVFNYDVVSVNNPGKIVGVRFGDFAEVGELSTNRITLLASALKTGTGIRSDQTGNELLDLGYDASANAFLFA